MRDVSGTFDHYRISARSIWNTAFWPDPDFRNWDSIDEFKEIAKILFRELVLQKLDKDWPLHDIFRTPITFFHVVPRSKTVSIKIRNPRPGDSAGYWDHPVNWISQGDAEMHFVGYFDWNQMDYIDLRYYLVKLARFDAHADLVGREALIEPMSANIYLADE